MTEVLLPDQDATQIAVNPDAGAGVTAKPVAIPPEPVPATLPDPVRLQVGDTLKGTFELISVLGEGGMGTVFKALNKVWAELEARDPYIAIKVLKPELSSNKQLIRSLFSDFDRTKLLANCPNIIKVFGFNRDGPHVYMSMEYITGQTLDDYLQGQPLPLKQAWPIIQGIGTALSYAHRQNIVHRDIKPGNIMITPEGTVKVLDFGIASKINQTEHDQTKFGGHDLGAFTLSYASPEMQLGFPPDPRDDIYGFACVIYEILTGKQFFKQKIPKAAPIPGLSVRQMEALNRSLVFERQQRIADIQELLDKLQPTKIPWLKYTVAASLSTMAAIWMSQFLTTSGPDDDPVPKEVAGASPVIQVGPTAVPEVVAVPSAQQNDTVVSEPITPDSPTTEPAPEHTAPVFAAPAPALPEPAVMEAVAFLNTSKARYKNGQPFKVSFQLNQASFVRLIDRDANGVVTVLLPNPRQPDRLLKPNQTHEFPPKGFTVPVKGRAGVNTVTLITSIKPFPAKLKFLNKDGSIASAVGANGYGWSQTQYQLTK